MVFFTLKVAGRLSLIILFQILQDKENVIPSKRTFSEFDDVDCSDQDTEMKRQKTAESDSDDDYDDELIGMFRPENSINNL